MTRIWNAIGANNSQPLQTGIEKCTFVFSQTQCPSSGSRWVWRKDDDMARCVTADQETFLDTSHKATTCIEGVPELKSKVLLFLFL